MEDKYSLYDSVVTTIMTNVLVERERCGKFLLYDFDPNLDLDRLYFNVAAIAADIRRENLYLHMPFWSYVKFRIKRWKKRMNLKWFSPSQAKELDNDYKTSTAILMYFIADQLNIPTDLFKEINDAYYGWVK